eukprot:3712982-Pleurochrysis_carterae.AAC.1
MHKDVANGSFPVSHIIWHRNKVLGKLGYTNLLYARVPGGVATEGREAGGGEGHGDDDGLLQMSHGEAGGDCNVTRVGYSRAHALLYIKCTRCEDGGSHTCLECLDKASTALAAAVVEVKHQILQQAIWDDVFARAWRSPMASKSLSWEENEACWS